MKKLLMTCLLTVGLLAGLQAQSYITLQGGSAFPIGEFSKTDPNSDASGFASFGTALDLHYASWLASRKLGLMLDVQLTANEFNEDEFLFALNSQAGTSGININTNAYRIITVMPGLMIGKYSEDSKSDYYGFVKMGLMSLATPEVVVSAGGISERIESESGSGFGYGLGFGAHWVLSGNFGVSGTVEYVGGNIPLADYDQPVGNINALFGVFVHL